MRGSPDPAGGRAALLVLALLFGCDVYDARRLQGAPLGADPDMPAPYVALCGNGRLDPDEQCDTGISEGEGACPIDCPSEDPCVPQVPSGEDCLRSCVALPTVRAINGDQCCPMGMNAAQDSDCGTCGDEILSPLETCEPAASCVTRADCAAIAACVRGKFSGDPERCSSLCQPELIEDCHNADGCCPAACNAGNDNDCSATCGNGIVEPENNETCEPDSTSSPCPSSCDDGIACTTDVSSGTAQQCNVTCSHVPVTAPNSGDGCCPFGANSLNDDDCLAVCGNQLVESGETCDPCPANCDDQNACTTDSRSGSGCGVVCGHTAITAPAGGDGCCPVGAHANNDSDCSPVCGNGVVEPGEECDGGGRCNASCDLVLPSSLVHRYSFNGTGTMVVDSMGTAHGTVVNTTLSGNGRVTLAGDSSDQYVDLPNGILSAWDDITIEVWATWQGGSTSQRVFDFGMNSAGEGSNSGTGTHYFYLNPRNSSTDSLMFGANFTDAGGDYATADHQILVSPYLDAGTRRHLVVTFRDPGSSSSKTLTLYLDGVEVGSTSVPASSDGTNNRLRNLDDRNAWIGRSNYSPATFTGSFEEVRIYNAALSASAVAANFSAGPNP